MIQKINKLLPHEWSFSRKEGLVWTPDYAKHMDWKKGTPATEYLERAWRLEVSETAYDLKPGDVQKIFCNVLLVKVVVVVGDTREQFQTYRIEKVYSNQPLGTGTTIEKLCKDLWALEV